MDIASDLTHTSYTYETDITTGDTYSFRVKARNSVGFSDFSESLEIIAAT